MSSVEEGISAFTRVGAKPGHPRRGAGSGPSFFGRLLGWENKPTITPQGILLPRDWKEHGFLGMALAFPARGRVVPRTTFSASIQEGRAFWRQSQEVIPIGRKAQPAHDWRLKQPMNTGRSRCGSCPESNGP